MARPMKNFWVFLLGLFGLSGGAAFAATQGVLCGSDIQGESEYPAAIGCTDVLAWSWGLSGTLGPVGGGGGGAQASFQDISLTKNIDASSEDLFRLAAMQTAMSGVVEYREYATCGTGCTPSQPYLSIHMKGVRVTSQSMGGSSGENVHTENISLNFTAISYCYRPTVKGTPGPKQCFAFDVLKNASTTPF